MIEQDDFDAEEDSWVSDWLKFINAVLGIKICRIQITKQEQ